MTKRIPSTQAQVAKLIRSELKEIGITDATVKSGKSGHSGKVDITLYDKSPEQVEQVKNITAKYKYGHFDGMQDMYVSSNTNPELPQVKYIFISSKFSKEVEQIALNYIANCYKLGELTLDNLPYLINVGGREEHPKTTIRRLLTGGDSASSYLWEKMAKKLVN